MKTINKLIIFVLTSLALAASAYAQSPRERLIFVPPAVTAQPVGTRSLPVWLQERVASYATSALGSVPDEVWQFEYRGKTVYYIPAPCCDQFDSLFAADGTYLCAPSGGYSGYGDQRCSDALLKPKEMTRVWQDYRRVRQPK